VRKVYVLKPGEDWIVDRFVDEWNIDNADIVASDIHGADVIWLMAEWCWNRLPSYMLAPRRKVITTVHHIVPQKFNDIARQEFAQRDRYTTAYHVPNKHTEAFIRPLTQKPIHVIPYWANERIWKKTDSREALRKKHHLLEASYIIGSFQRDSEGSNLMTPKMEKGPDLLATYVYDLVTSQKHKHVTLLLAGWRRHYLINRLHELFTLTPGWNVSNDCAQFSNGETVLIIQFPDAAVKAVTANQIVPQEMINELYQTLDLYPVTARYEGGPQSLIECGLLGIPCVSRPVGIASDVLPLEAIGDRVELCTPAVPNVEALKLPAGYAPFRKLIEEV